MLSSNKMCLVAITLTLFSTGSSASAPADLIAQEPLLDLRSATPADPNAMIDLLIWLRSQPLARISREEKERFAQSFLGLSAEIRTLRSWLEPPFPAAAANHDAWLRQVHARAADLDLLHQRREALDSLRDDLRIVIATRTWQETAPEQDALEILVANLGGVVLRRIPLVNAATVRLPAASLRWLTVAPEVAHIESARPVRNLLDLQRTSLGLDSPQGFWSHGIEGSPFDVGVLDTGVQQDHPAFFNQRFDSLIGTTDSDGHGTAVAGVIAANDAGVDQSCLQDGSVCGVAWDTDTLLVGSSLSMDVLADADWMLSGASQGPEAINLSAGYGTADDLDYSGFDAFWDAIVDAFALTVCVAAGDGGPGAGGASPTTLTHPASAYNTIAIADMADQNTIDRLDDRIAPLSSRGPTLAGRKKPDLAAPGDLTLTTDNDWAAGPDFLEASGTSMATPHCTGAAVLLTDLLGTADPLLIKARLINSAETWTDGATPADPQDDGPVAGSAWNPTYGWGYLDLRAAANTNFSSLRRGTVANDGITPRFRLYRLTPSSFPKATIVWNRHVDYIGTVLPTAFETLSNLDLRLFDVSTNVLVDESISEIDNVEQVGPDTPQPSEIIAKVELVGALDPDLPFETFALAARNRVTLAIPPAYNVELLPPNFAPLRPFVATFRVTNSGDVPVFDNSASLSLPAGYTILEGANPQTITRIDQEGLFSWTVSPPCDASEVAFELTVEGAAFGEKISTVHSALVQPSVPNLSPGPTSLHTGTNQLFSFATEANKWSMVASWKNVETVALDAFSEVCDGIPFIEPVVQNLGGQPFRSLLVNGNILGAMTSFVLLSTNPPDPNIRFILEHDLATDLELGVPRQVLVDSNRFELFQTMIEAGRSYEVRLSGTGDFSRPGILVFDATRDLADASLADYVGTTGGAQTGTSVFFTAKTTGFYGLLVVRRLISGLDAATLEIVEVDPIFTDDFESGDTSAWSQTVRLRP